MSCTSHTLHKVYASNLGNRLVHHTRNTNEKQWNETVVFAMQGIIRVFRTFFPTLSALDDFSKHWAQLLSFFETFAGSKSVEVSKVWKPTLKIQSANGTPQNAISLLKELMHPQVTSEVFARVLWENMWECLSHISRTLTQNRGVEFFHQMTGQTPEQPQQQSPTQQRQTEEPQESILELVHTVDFIHTKFRDVCTPGDIKRWVTASSYQ